MAETAEKKNILIIGGSYFIGRIFVLGMIKKTDYTLHILNRGHNPLRLPGVKEYVCDRRDLPRLAKAVPPLEYDTVIDFCADFPGEIKALLENLPGTVKHYIYISSCSVFRPSPELPKTEDSPKLTSPPPGPAGEYAYNKALLEQETQDFCGTRGIPWTVLRPAFVYGPFNYAPRESFFFDLLLTGETIPVPRESLALFQFVYVKDIAKFLFRCLGNAQAYNKAFNLSAEELISYDRLMEVLREISGHAVRTAKKSLQEITEENIPLPFPLDSHEIFAGALAANTLQCRYTPFAQGMQETFAFYRKYHADKVKAELFECRTDGECLHCPAPAEVKKGPLGF